jgi:flavin reductase (DIM6/NTAB) family NADH-FMN oxidoreductase RutF
MTTPALIPSINEAEFRDFMRHWPTGVAVVTTMSPSRPVGCTVNALLSLSVEPPLLVVSLAEESRTLEAIRRVDLFGISILAAAQEELSDRFANCAREQRFTGLELRVEHGLPLLAGAAAQMVCAVQQLEQIADHVLVVGAPIWQSVDPGRAPLLLHHTAG